MIKTSCTCTKRNLHAQEKTAVPGGSGEGRLHCISESLLSSVVFPMDFIFNPFEAWNLSSLLICSVYSSQRTLSFSVTKIRRLMLLKQIINLCCENYKQHLSRLCGQNKEFWKVKALVHIIPWRVKTSCGHDLCRKRAKWYIHVKRIKIFVILKCAIAVACLKYKVGWIQSKNTTINRWLNDGVY